MTGRRLRYGDYVALEWLADFTEENEGPLPVVFRVRDHGLRVEFNPYESGGYDGEEKMFRFLNGKDVKEVFSQYSGLLVDELLGTRLCSYEGGFSEYEGLYDEHYWSERFASKGIVLRRYAD